mmetsp:Transcript_15250/g.61298  ORF Transcript_15250/g.61298 Transcript_15250/m.61298 type:complete len:454 (-) Transcript_15250:385-1746(-)
MPRTRCTALRALGGLSTSLCLRVRDSSCLETEATWPQCATTVVSTEYKICSRPRHGTTHRSSGCAKRRASKTKAAWPWMMVRSPSVRTRSLPPRLEAWCATRGRSPLVPRTDSQYAVRSVCAEPVTGSSWTPYLGAKKRLSKSTPGRFEAHVTMTPRSTRSLVARTPMSTGADAKSSTPSKWMNTSGTDGGPLPAKASETGPFSWMPTARSIAAGISSRGTSVSGPVGKSIESHGAVPSSSPPLRTFETRSEPARRVSNSRTASSATRRVSNSAAAAASVAWPHRSTSRPGVHHRIAYFDGPSRLRKADSDRLFSFATLAIQSSLLCEKTTAAGFPENAPAGGNASSCTISNPSAEQSNHASLPCWIADGPSTRNPAETYNASSSAFAMSLMLRTPPENACSSRYHRNARAARPLRRYAGATTTLWIARIGPSGACVFIASWRSAEGVTGFIG